MTKYFEGDKIGPYNTLFLKRLPKSRGIFKCSFCGTLFNSKISHIVDGGTKSCGCQHYIYKYKEGDKIGPYKILFKQRLPCIKKSKTKYYYSGIFECPYCGKDFTAEISAISCGLIRSCTCLSKKDLTNQRFGKLIAIEPTEKRSGTSVIWKCKCDCGEECFASENNLIRKKKRSCRKCSKSVSTGELKIETFLNKNNINFIEEFTLPNRQRLDFYIENLKIAIEYNGIQHYESIDFFGGEEAFKKRQELDEQKRQYCKNNGIKLIEIPYWNYDNIEKILIKELNL